VHVLFTYIAWLSLPAVMMIIALFYAPFNSGPRGVQEFTPNNTYIVRKDKLNRTVKTLSGEDNGPVPVDMGAAGLPLELLIRENEWDDLLNKRNVRRHYKKRVHDIVINVDEKALLLGTYHIRGKSSTILAYKSNHPDHLSYSITLFNPIQFAPGIKLKKFFLMNMIADSYYYEMLFSNQLLHDLGQINTYTH
jgi:hypothetical protein